MKSNIFKSLSLLILMAMAFVGCSEHDGVVYSGDSAVYAFAGATQKVEMLATDGNKIVVPVYRGTTQGTSTLELTFTPAEGTEELFTLENPTLTFEDGKSVAEAVITYKDINLLGVTDQYVLTLGFDEAKASPTNVNSITVKAQRKLTFKSIGTGTFTSNIFGDSWPQVIEKAVEADVYRLPDCYYEGYPIIFSMDENGEIANIAIQETGYVDKDYGMTSFYCTGTEKSGNKHNISAFLVVNYNGGLAKLFDEFVTLEFPE